MQHISKILEKHKTPFKELVTKHASLVEKDLEKMTAWERSTYREIMKYATKSNNQKQYGCKNMFSWQKGNHCEEFESLESKLLNIELDLQDYAENLDLNNFDGNILNLFIANQKN